MSMFLANDDSMDSWAMRRDCSMDDPMSIMPMNGMSRA